jgi:tRNA-splicing ligase RtcB
MSERKPALLRAWLAAPLDQEVSAALDRLRRAPDVELVAVMPDVHLGTDVCIGVVVATSRSIYPQAVGGDIGCGMLALGFDVEANLLDDPATAGRVLSGLGQAVPARRRNRRAALSLPPDLERATLSHPSLEAVRKAKEAIEFGTLGSGNHFIELQSDDDDRLWLMVHSGSRGIGPAIRDHHLKGGEDVGGGLRRLEAASELGIRYLHDATWARRFAEASRKAMATQVAELLADCLGAQPRWETLISTDHNHVAREPHGEQELWVHRKGAMSARCGETGVLPGSMGSPSFHVEGRGHEPSLCSSAHGAGRAWSRCVARNKITRRELLRQMRGVWFDFRLADQLRDEAPPAYKDIRVVLRAQSDLVKVVRTLRPVLNYKGT